jgi:hypothetical protein
VTALRVKPAVACSPATKALKAQNPKLKAQEKPQGSSSKASARKRRRGALGLGFFLSFEL